jgi:hypothetical protein
MFSRRGAPVHGKLAIHKDENFVKFKQLHGAKNSGREA